MGASGYEGHIVVCGWNSTARDLIDELMLDEYDARVVVIHDTDKNPAGDGVYFVRGDATNEEDLKRAGIMAAAAAIICPATATDDADMRSILIVLAIETMAPHVRTVVEVNNPRHVPHFRRANVDEVLVTPILASHLLARTAMYPGLSGLVTDMVSGGPAGSELYRVVLPDDYITGSVDDLSAMMRAKHDSTMLAIGRGDSVVLNPRTDFRLRRGDHAIVVAKSLSSLAPLRFADLVHESSVTPPPSPPALVDGDRGTDGDSSAQPPRPEPAAAPGPASVPDPEPDHRPAPTVDKDQTPGDTVAAIPAKAEEHSPEAESVDAAPGPDAAGAAEGGAEEPLASEAPPARDPWGRP